MGGVLKYNYDIMNSFAWTILLLAGVTLEGHNGGPSQIKRIKPNTFKTISKIEGTPPLKTNKKEAVIIDA